MRIRNVPIISPGIKPRIYDIILHVFLKLFPLAYYSLRSQIQWLTRTTYSVVLENLNFRPAN